MGRSHHVTHMVRKGELIRTKKTVDGVECFRPAVMNEFTPQVVEKSRGEMVLRKCVFFM